MRQPIYLYLGWDRVVLTLVMILFKLSKPLDIVMTWWLVWGCIYRLAFWLTVTGRMALFTQLTRLLTRPIWFGVRNRCTVFLQFIAISRGSVT